MNFKEYSEGFIDFIDNLTEEEFLNMLESVGVEKYFSAFSYKSKKIKYNKKVHFELEKTTTEKIKVSFKKNKENEQKYDYTLPRELRKKYNPCIYKGAA